MKSLAPNKSFNSVSGTIKKSPAQGKWIQRCLLDDDEVSNKVSDPSGIQDALSSHWGPIYEKREGASKCLLFLMFSVFMGPLISLIETFCVIRCIVLARDGGQPLHANTIRPM